MALSDDDLKAIGNLVKLENQNLQSDLVNKLDSRFDEISKQIDGLYKRDELREQEYLALKEQISRLEN